MNEYIIIGEPIIEKEKIFKNVKLPFNFTININKFKNFNYLIIYDKIGNVNDLCYYIKDTNFQYLKEIEIPKQCLKHQTIINYEIGNKGKLADYHIYNYNEINDCYLLYSKAIDTIYLTNPRIVNPILINALITPELTDFGEKKLIANNNINLEPNLYKIYLILGLDNNTNKIKDAYLIYLLENNTIQIQSEKNIFNELKNKKIIFYNFYGNFDIKLNYRLYAVSGSYSSGLAFLLNKNDADGFLKNKKGKYYNSPINESNKFIIIPFKIDYLIVPNNDKTIYSEYIENCPIAYIKYKNEICKIQFNNEKEFTILNNYNVYQNNIPNNEIVFDIFNKHILFYVEKNNVLYYDFKNYWGDIFFNYQEEQQKDDFKNDLIILKNNINNESNIYINTYNYSAKLLERIENIKNDNNILIYYGYKNDFYAFYDQLIDLRKNFSLYYLVFVCFKDIIYPNTITQWRSNINNLQIDNYTKIITLQQIDLHTANHIFIFNNSIYIDRIDNDINDININDIIGIKINNRLLLYKITSVNEKSIYAIFEPIEDNTILTNISEKQFYHFKEIFINNINNINFYYKLFYEIPYDIFLRQLKPIEDDYIVYIEPLAIINNVLTKSQNNIINIKKEITNGLIFAKYRIDDLLKNINLFSFTYDKRYISFIENNNELKRYLKNNGIDIIDNVLFKYSITSTNLPTNYIYKIILLTKMQYNLFNKITRKHSFNKRIIENTIKALINDYKKIVSGVKELKIDYKLDETKTKIILNTKINLDNILIKNINIQIL